MYRRVGPSGVSVKTGVQAGEMVEVGATSVCQWKSPREMWDIGSVKWALYAPQPRKGQSAWGRCSRLRKPISVAQLTSDLTSPPISALVSRWLHACHPRKRRGLLSLLAWPATGVGSGEGNQAGLSVFKQTTGMASVEESPAHRADKHSSSKANMCSRPATPTTKDGCACLCSFHV